jgi:CHAT domain-containing protein
MRIQGPLLIAVLLVQCASAPAQEVELRSSASHKLQSHDYDGAIQDYQRALANLPAQDSAEAADLLLELAAALYFKTDYDGSKSRAQQAREIYQRVYGPEHRSVARALTSEAVAVLAAGAYELASPLFERALAISRNDPGPEHRETVSLMERFAVNLTRAGQYARAKVMQEEVLAIAERQFGEEDTLTAQTLTDLGQLLVQMGDYASAMQYHRRALTVMEHRSGKDSLDVANTLIGMGNDARDAADYLNAKTYLERAAAIYESHLGARDTRVGGALDNLGQTLVLMKHFAEARTVLDRAFAIQTESLGARHPWTANVMQSQALLEAGLGNYEKAGELLQQNLDIWSHVLGPEHPFTLASLTAYADVLAHRGQYGEALATALRSAEARRDNIARTVRTVDERQALQYAALQRASMDTALTLASRPEASPAEREQTWDALIRSRTLVLDEMGARHRSIRESIDPEMAVLEQRLTADRNQITKLVLQGPGSLPLAEYSKRLDASRSAWEQAGTALAVKSASFRQKWTQQRAGFSELQAALPPGSALVAYRRYRRMNYQATGNSATDSYVAFVLPGPGQAPVAVPLGAASRIESMVTKWRGEIDRERGALGRAERENEAHYREAGAALRQLVWDPVQRRLGSASRVYIVPDGALQLVNFAALPASNGGYLVESGPLLHLLAAERDLTTPTVRSSATELLVVADPQFQAKPNVLSTAIVHTASYRGASSTCPDFASLAFGRLPGSLAEGQSILAIWTGQGWQGTLLTGNRASEGALREMTPGKRVVHIATHGFFLDSQCPASAVARENPLLRSGLAMAGANQRQSAAAGEDDGILTAEEAASLDLAEAEWVVLSGCDTGVGDVQSADGVLGLRRAFQEAGARTLIASLWPVDDNDARDWMGTLYRTRFRAGKSTAESVRAAYLGQLRARRKSGKSTHPFYWAGFVAVGDWQ